MARTGDLNAKAGKFTYRPVGGKNPPTKPFWKEQAVHKAITELKAKNKITSLTKPAEVRNLHTLFQEKYTVAQWRCHYNMWKKITFHCASCKYNGCCFLSALCFCCSLAAHFFCLFVLLADDEDDVDDDEEEEEQPNANLTVVRPVFDLAQVVQEH